MRPLARSVGTRRVPSLLVVLFAIGSLLPGFAGSAMPDAPWVVLDSLGREVGRATAVQEETNRMQVAMELNGEVAFVLIERDLFSHGTRPVVFYTSTDCTGRPFVLTQTSMPTVGIHAAVAGPTQTLYRGSPLASRRQRMASAMWSTSCKVLDPPLELDFMPVYPVMHLAFEFAPPFKAVPVSSPGPGARR